MAAKRSTRMSREVLIEGRGEEAVEGQVTGTPCCSWRVFSCWLPAVPAACRPPQPGPQRPTLPCPCALTFVPRTHPPDAFLPADEQMQECAVDVLTKVACTAGAAHPGWCEECALPRMLKLAMHRDYNIRVVGGRSCTVVLFREGRWELWWVGAGGR